VKIEIRDKIYYLRNNPALLSETLDEFSTKGFSAASLNEILKRSGFNKGSFYYRFSEKRDLYVALMGDLYQRHSDLLGSERVTVIEPSGFRVAINVMIGSLFRLHDVDPRYVALYARSVLESDDVRQAVIDVHGASPIDRFLEESGKTLCETAAVPQEAVDLFVRIAATVLKNIAAIARREDTWIDADAIATALASFVSPQPPEREGKPMRFRDIDKIDDRISAVASETGLSLSQREIVAVVGPRRAGKTFLLNLIGESAATSAGTVGFFSGDLTKLGKDGSTLSPTSLRLNRTPRSNLARSGFGKGSAEAADTLHAFGLAEVADIRLDRLPDSAKILTDFAAGSRSSARLILIEDAMRSLPQSDKERIYRLLLKWKDNGNTIVLSTTCMDEALSVADRVLFLSGGTNAQPMPVADLKRKYGAKAVVVDYVDGGVQRRAVFQAAALADSAFRAIAEGKTISNIATGVISGDDIYRLETGASLQ